MNYSTLYDNILYYNGTYHEELQQSPKKQVECGWISQVQLKHTRPLLLRPPGMKVEVDIADSGNNKYFLCFKLLWSHDEYLFILYM